LSLIQGGSRPQFRNGIKIKKLIQIMLVFQVSELLLNFDEHVLTNNFKFGVIYQKFGQVNLNSD